MILDFETHLVKKTEIAANIFILGFQIDSKSPLDYRPGQYIILLVPVTGQGFPTRRLYSIFEVSPEKNYFELLVEFIPGGLGSEYLKKAVINDKVKFQGPAGLFTLRETKDRPVYFLATGTGIAPIYQLALEFSKTNSNTKGTLLFGLRNFKDLYLYNKLKNLQTGQANITFKVCLSREATLDAVGLDDKKNFILGRVTSELDKVNDGDLLKSHFYVCGGKSTVESIRQYLESRGVPKEQIFFERFS